MDNPISYQLIGALVLAVTKNTNNPALSELIRNLFYVARVLILAVGGGVGLVKIVKGKSDENPRDFHEGLFALAAAGVLFSATFAVQAILK